MPPLQQCGDCGGEWFMVHNCPGAVKTARDRRSDPQAVLVVALRLQLKVLEEENSRLLMRIKYLETQDRVA